MVQTKSRATSPGHQKSRDASSNPHHDCQSALVIQQSSIQHMQSMAAAIAELTQQNQELTKEINLKVKPKIRKIEEMLNLKTSQGVPRQEGYHIWRRKWIR